MTPDIMQSDLRPLYRQEEPEDLVVLLDSLRCEDQVQGPRRQVPQRQALPASVLGRAFGDRDQDLDLSGDTLVVMVAGAASGEERLVHV